MENWKKNVLRDALFVPDNTKNLISDLKLREVGVDVFFVEKPTLVFNIVSFFCSRNWIVCLENFNITIFLI